MTSSGFLQRSPAKLNWTLEVRGRRRDGYHELRSWFVAAALYDELSCAPRAADEDAPALRISGPAAAGLPQDRTNLVSRAEHAWRAAGGEAPSLRWSLIKNIPAGAGLGGGSGNAAAALCLLQAMAEVAGRKVEDLAGLALSIGSDVPFFLQQSSAVLLGGRGEVLLHGATAPTGWVVIAVPEFAVSTSRVFDALAAPLLEDAAGASTAGAFDLPPLPTENALLDAAQQAYPQLRTFHDMLDAAADFQLSGSGGTFFAYFPDHGSAERCAASTRAICSRVFVAPLQAGPILRPPSAIPAAGGGA
jgi:4-diphosphocytidyl-2-C-methyl-D-erythritol kinase